MIDQQFCPPLVSGVCDTCNRYRTEALVVEYHGVQARLTCLKPCAKKEES